MHTSLSNASYRPSLYYIQFDDHALTYCLNCIHLVVFCLILLEFTFNHLNHPLLMGPICSSVLLLLGPYSISISLKAVYLISIRFHSVPFRSIRYLVLPIIIKFMIASELCLAESSTIAIYELLGLIFCMHGAGPSRNRPGDHDK